MYMTKFVFELVHLHDKLIIKFIYYNRRLWSNTKRRSSFKKPFCTHQWCKPPIYRSNNHGKMSDTNVSCLHRNISNFLKIILMCLVHKQPSTNCSLITTNIQLLLLHSFYQNNHRLLSYLFLRAWWAKKVFHSNQISVLEQASRDQLPCSQWYKERNFASQVWLCP